MTSNAASGYVAKVSMLRLKSGSVLDGPNPDGLESRMGRMDRNAGWAGWSLDGLNPDGVRMGRNAGWAGWAIPDGSRMVSNCPDSDVGEGQSAAIEGRIATLKQSHLHPP